VQAQQWALHAEGGLAPGLSAGGGTSDYITDPTVGAASLAWDPWTTAVDPTLPRDQSADDARSLAFTSAPLATPLELVGSPAAVLDVALAGGAPCLVVKLADVAPNGRSTPLTSGALLGSFRKLDPGLTWRAPNGRPIAPYHPYTRSSAKPVQPGKATRYDIEIFPTLAELGKGHRLRLTLTTSDTPHLLPNPGQAANLAGGIYTVQRNAAAASYLEVPMARPRAFRPCDLCR
jgi:putative CocE/NonD family hydrolase